jgi:hypothetical protein
MIEPTVMSIPPIAQDQTYVSRTGLASCRENKCIVHYLANLDLANLGEGQRVETVKRGL